MIKRRDFVLGTLAAGVVARTGSASAKASQPATPVNFAVPPGACDCHTHIHGDPAMYPMFAGRTYTPEPALPEEMTRLHKALHMQRVVIVTPSIYGTDNTSTLYGMKARGANARGVAVIDDRTTESELDTMGQLGVRGIRLNLATGGVNDPAVGRQRFQAAVARMKPRQWHIQMYTNLAMISGIKDARRRVARAGRVRSFRRRPGRARYAADGLRRPGGAGALGQGLRQDLGRLSLLEERSGLRGCRAARAGAHRGERGPHPLGHRLAASERSRRQRDRISPFFEIDDGRLLNQLPVWAPDAAVRKKILVDNPARLYQF